MSTRVAAIVRSARAGEKRYGASAIAPILNRIGHLSLDDLALDPVFADAGPLQRTVAGKDVDGGVDELGIVEQIPLPVRPGVAGTALDDEAIGCRGRREPRRARCRHRAVAPLGRLTYAPEHRVDLHGRERAIRGVLDRELNRRHELVAGADGAD